MIRCRAVRSGLGGFTLGAKSEDISGFGPAADSSKPMTRSRE